MKYLKSDFELVLRQLIYVLPPIGSNGFFIRQIYQKHDVIVENRNQYGLMYDLKSSLRINTLQPVKKDCLT